MKKNNLWIYMCVCVCVCVCVYACVCVLPKMIDNLIVKIKDIHVY